MGILCDGHAHGDFSFGFVFGQERFIEEGLRIQATTLVSELIKSLVTFGGGIVTVRDDNDPIFGKTSELGGFQTGCKGRMVNNEQFCLGRVELVQKLVDGESRVCRGGDSTEPVRSPGGDRELDMIWGEKSDAVVVADIPAGFHDICESIGASLNLLEEVAPTRVIVNEPRRVRSANRPIGVVVVEEELSNGQIGGNVWDGAIGGDKFLDKLRGRHANAG